MYQSIRYSRQLHTSSMVPTPASGDAPQTTAFLARTSGLDATHTDAYKALINGLVSDGIFSKFDCLYIFATQDQATALLNLVSSSYTITLTGSPTFTVDRGFTNNNTGTIYEDTNFNASTAGGNYTQDSAHMSVWMVTYPDGGATPNTASGATRQYILPNYGLAGTAYYRINSGGGVSGAVPDGLGHALANRSTSNNVEGYRNGSQIVSAADASAALNNANFTFPDIVPIAGEGGQTAGGSFGGSLTSTEVTNFYNRLRTYMTTVGVP